MCDSQITVFAMCVYACSHFTFELADRFAKTVE